MDSSKSRFENALYRADCLALLERLPAAHADLIYLDPPLAPGSVLGPERHDLAEHLAWIGLVFAQCQRVLAPGGALVLQLPERAPGGYRMLLDWLFGWGRLRDEIVWVFQRSSRKARRAHQTLLFYGAGAAGQTGKVPLVTPNANTVWDDIPRLHSSQKLPMAGQKPLALLERIILAGCPAGGLVLDPFMGTGSTLLAAARLGRRWLGCDVLTDAFAAALDQLRDTVVDVDLRSSDQDALESAPIIEVADGSSLQRLIDMALGTHTDSAEFAFTYGGVVPEEEDRTTEFKLVTGGNPASSISTVAERYAVAFLNSEGGNIYWGIRDDRTVIGVPLTSGQRDQVRQAVNSRLTTIRPQILPDAFRLTFYPVADPPDGTERSVVELKVPSLRHRDLLFSTGNEEVHVRVDGVCRKLSMVQVQEWVRRTERAQQVLDRLA